MSSAILYLAIIAIWAVFLVPAWIRRPHDASAAQDGQAEEEEAFAPGTEHGDWDDRDDLARDAAPGYGAGGQERARSAGRRRPVAFVSDDGYAAADLYDSDGELAGDGEYADDREYAGDSRYAPQEDYEGGARQPSQSREQMLRARRRMLTILIGLTLITTAAVAAGLVQWWICVPPIAMLVLYVLLLREIALADAEQAHKRAAWEAARLRAQAPHRRESRERQSDPVADVIDIRDRVGDELYDQYADAEMRAVGD